MTPASVRWKADNFSNLFEQPTQFYAVAAVLAIAGGGKTDARLAWAYVAARIAHSLSHCTTNNVVRRFAFYLISSGLVAVLTGRAALCWRLEGEVLGLAQGGGVWLCIMVWLCDGPHSFAYSMFSISTFQSLRRTKIGPPAKPFYFHALHDRNSC